MKKIVNGKHMRLLNEVLCLKNIIRVERFTVGLEKDKRRCNVKLKLIKKGFYFTDGIKIFRKKDLLIDGMIKRLKFFRVGVL